MSDDDKEHEIKTEKDYQNIIKNLHENHFTATQPAIPQYESLPISTQTNFWGKRRDSVPGKTDKPTKSIKEEDNKNRCIIL